MRAKRRGALGAGEDDGQRIARPRRLALLVGRAAPEVDDTSPDISYFTPHVRPWKSFFGEYVKPNVS